MEIQKLGFAFVTAPGLFKWRVETEDLKKEDAMHSSVLIEKNPKILSGYSINETKK